MLKRVIHSLTCNRKPLFLRRRSLVWIRHGSFSCGASDNREKSSGIQVNIGDKSWWARLSAVTCTTSICAWNPSHGQLLSSTCAGKSGKSNCCTCVPVHTSVCHTTKHISGGPDHDDRPRASLVCATSITATLWTPSKVGKVQGQHQHSVLSQRTGTFQLCFYYYCCSLPPLIGRSTMVRPSRPMRPRHH